MCGHSLVHIIWVLGLLDSPAADSLLCPLSRKLMCISSSNLPGNFALKKCREIFGEFFLVPVSHETKHENSSKIWAKFGANLGAKSGTKIRKILQLS